MADGGTPRSLVPLLVTMMLVTGVCNTLLTKYQDMQCVADCDTANPKAFEQPVLQTLQMFIGESGCWLVVFVSFLVRRYQAKSGSDGIEYQAIHDQEDGDLPPRYEDGNRTETADGYEEPSEGLDASQTSVDPTNAVAKPLVDGQVLTRERIPLTGWKILLLALPSICDILGTTLMNAGLLFVAASIYQMTRGALVLFVGLFSVLFLKRHLGGWKWASLFVVVLGVAIVGLAGALESKKHAHEDLPSDTVPGPDEKLLAARITLILRGAQHMIQQAAPTTAETVLGVFMIAGAQIFTASQFVIEESLMEKYSMKPIHVVGWEGLFGFTITLIGMGVLHGAIGTGYFNARAGFHQFFTNRAVGISSLLIMISIGGFNFFGLSVTRSLSATSRSTIDTCRTLFIWIVSLGLGWESFKWLQVVGFALLVYGTGVFNDIIRPPTVSWLRRQRQRQSPA